MLFKITTIFLFLFTVLTTQASNIWGLQPGIVVVSDFLGGLNINKIRQCRKVLIYKCEKAADINLQEDPSCLQANDIFAITGLVPDDDIKQCGNINIISVTHMADAIPSYFLIDASGELIDIDNYPFPKLESIGKDPIGVGLIKKFSDVTVTSQIESFQCQKKSDVQQVILGQIIKDMGGCVGCSKVGTANIAYEFNLNGKFLGSKLISVTSNYTARQ